MDQFVGEKGLLSRFGFFLQGCGSSGHDLLSASASGAFVACSKGKIPIGNPKIFFLVHFLGEAALPIQSVASTTEQPRKSQDKNVERHSHGTISIEKNDGIDKQKIWEREIFTPGVPWVLYIGFFADTANSMSVFNIFRIFGKSKNSLGYNLTILFGTMALVFPLRTLYYQVQKLYDKFLAHTMVEEGDKEGKRILEVSEYYGNIFPIKNIVIPVYRKSSSFQKVVVDFHIVSSHGGIKEYFWNDYNVHLIYDRLNSRLAPMALEFPLEEEGKTVIKEKVLRELNQLVKELKLEGEIREVYIGRILAG